MSSTELGSRIAAARGTKGLNQTDLAHALGVASQAVWRWEQGRVTPTAARLVAIADATGVTLDWLLRGEGHGPTMPPPAGTGEVRS
jgi:transcriptional regulator with XRE-family HTH domain